MDWHTGRSMHCVPAQVCMLPFPSDAGRVGWLMHVTFWLHIAMCCALVGGFAGIACSLCALVGGFAGIACSLSLQPCTVASCVNWLVVMQEAMLMCIYVAASSSHCYLLVGSSASNSAPALFPTHPLLEDLTRCLLSCAACMCRHVCCTLPTDR